MTDAEIERIKRAIRVWNAAKNAYKLAHRELAEAIPKDLAVLHCPPGTPRQPGTFYWIYYGDGSWTCGTEERCVDRGQQAVIVELPPPTAERLSTELVTIPEVER